MEYSLYDLMTRLGVGQEVTFNRPARWSYTDPEQKGVGGFAEVRFDVSETVLTIELRHWKGAHKTDIGLMNDRRVETIFVEAMRSGDSDNFSVSVMILDGDVYEVFDESLLDLVLSIFRSRAIEINMKMVEQKFKCKATSISEILDHLPAPQGQDNRPRPTAEIIPFRPRADAPVQRI